MKKLIAGAALLGSMLIAASPAQALIITAVTQGENTVDTSASVAGLLAVNFDFVSPRASTLTVELEAADVGSTLGFNSVVNNFTESNIRDARLQLSGATFLPFDPARIIEPTFAASADALADEAATSIAFRFGGVGEPNAFYIGNPFGSREFDNLLIDLSTLGVGESFQLELSVPEPGNLGLLGFGAIALGLAGLRKRRAIAA